MESSSSLVESVFGGGSRKASKQPLIGLFDSSTILPDRPNKTNFAERRSRKSASKKEKHEASVQENTNKKSHKSKVRKEPRNETSDSSKTQDNAAEKRTDRTPSTSGGQDALETEKKDETDSTKYHQNDANVDERTIFVGNLPSDTTRKSLAALFKHCGKIVSTRLRSVAGVAGVKLPPQKAGDQNLVKKVCINTQKLTDDAPKRTAQGYVVFEEKESALKAILEMNNKKIDNAGGWRLRVDHATPTVDPSRSLFVGNLPYHADEASITFHFEKHMGGGDKSSDSSGIVEGVRIVRDSDTLKCKGFGYVLFANSSLAAEALRVHETMYLNKTKLRVMVCGKRTKGKRGVNTKESPTKKTAGAARRIDSKKRSLEQQPSGSLTSQPPAKKKRLRGKKPQNNASGKGSKHGAGISKRAAAESKLNKRVKKLEKRVAKGMGKARKK